MVKKVKRRKRKLKKKFKIFLFTMLILIILAISLTLILTNTNQAESKPPKDTTRKPEEIITSILSYQLEEGIDANFLNWINEEYQTKTLEELETYLKESEYNST